MIVDINKEFQIESDEYNWIVKQKKVKGDALITTVLFDDRYELLHEREEIKDVAKLTENEYFVRGCTALLDAVGKTITKIAHAQKQMDEEVVQASGRIRTAAAFGEIIILIVYMPILFLVGIEGKMFVPMAQVVSFAILGAFILSLTYIPMISAL